MYKKLIILVLAVLLLQNAPAFAASPVASWTSPEGTEFISYSTAWKEANLQELYAELKNNTHGTELAYLESVTVQPHSDNFANGLYNQSEQDYSLPLNVPGFLPSTYEYQTRQGQITLFNGDQHTSTQSLARTLAHEYGHHFTYFHFFDPHKWQYSQYYTLRNLAHWPLTDSYATKNIDLYKQYWKWDIGEIAAEDYVQLMGSPNARPTVEAMDIRGMLSYSIANPKVSDSRIWANNVYTGRGGNTYPHGNIFLPLPLETPGLSEYFHSFVDAEPRLSYRSHPAPLLKHRRRSVNGATQHTFTWDPVSQDPDTLYTLVCYDEQRNAWAVIRTIRGNADLEAVVGTARQGNYTWSDGLTKGTKHFRLYVTFSDGYMISSPVETIRFSGATVKTPLPKEPEPPVIAVAADQDTATAITGLKINLQWDGTELEDTKIFYNRAVAITNSPQEPELWDWQSPGQGDTVISLDSPGEWYIHYHFSSEAETIRNSFGPFTIEAEPDQSQPWYHKLFSWLGL